MSTITELDYEEAQIYAKINYGCFDKLLKEINQLTIGDNPSEALVATKKYLEERLKKLTYTIREYSVNRARIIPFQGMII